jgi:5,10-methylenetetrahydromethanopterin reductase
MTGVIGHVSNPTRADAASLTRAAEHAGARWIGLADAFWWRDVWMLLEVAAAATDRIEIGPAMTNPHLRHPFHTVSALATLQEASPGRVFCGIAAGGSEVSGAAGISRADSADRARSLVQLIRHVAAGGALDEPSGRSLDLALAPTPILMAGRGDAMLAAAGATADRVLLWAIPRSDLERSVATVRRAASDAGRAPQLIWAPLVRHDDVPTGSLGHIAVYASLNTAPAIRATWGLDAETASEIRVALVRGELEAAIGLVPEAAFSDLVVAPGDAAEIAAQARSLGITELAVPGFATDTVGQHLAWAASIEARL